jgi:DNA-binding LacI/PurR family transcriptional regulator/DNA-binding transcriptional regulator YhcF (GntR family)
MADMVPTMNSTLTPSLRPAATSRQSAFYIQLRDQLRDSLVVSGKPGDRVPSERQLAKQFETSTVTIARILQELQESGLLMRVPGKGTFICEPPLAGAGELGETNEASVSAFTPQVGGPAFSNHALPARSTARSLRHTCIVATLSPEPDSASREYWAHRVVSPAERRLQRQGVRTTLVNRKDLSAEDLIGTLRRLLADGMDSLLYQAQGDQWVDGPGPSVDWDLEMLRLRETSGTGLTVVRLDFSGTSRTPFDSVSFDGSHGSFLATRHLLELGHREICFLSCPIDFQWVRERIQGFHRALALAGISSDAESFSSGEGERICRSANPPKGVNRWLWVSQDVARRFFEDRDASHRYTAVVALNDEIARSFIEEAGRRGFRVPGDFAVVGFDDRLESKAVGLTTIHLPIEEMGEAAVALMIQRHNEPFESGKIDVVLNPSLVVRSTAARNSREVN